MLLNVATGAMQTLLSQVEIGDVVDLVGRMIDPRPTGCIDAGITMLVGLQVDLQKNERFLGPYCLTAKIKMAGRCPASPNISLVWAWPILMYSAPG